MTQKHTPEPWPFFVDWAEPSTPNPESEPIVGLGYDDYQRARYCVNACKGVSNVQLALTSVSGVTLMLKEAEQQCDELLAALEEASTGLAWYQEAYPEAANGSDEEAMERINMAISKAKGGATITKITGEAK